MPVPTISAAERQFVLDGVAQGVRGDGRAKMDFRHIELEVGTLPQANGSALVRVADMVVLAGVKAAIEAPTAKRPKEGRIEVSVEVSGSATSTSADELVTSHTAVLDSMMKAACKDPATMQLLGVIASKYCWVLHVDVVVLGHKNVTPDMIAIAAFAALKDTRYPVLVINEADADYSLDHTAEMSPLPKALTAALPLCVTLSRLGNHLITDASSHELACSDTQITIAVNGKGNVCCVRKHGSGSWEPNLLFTALRASHLAALELFKQVDALAQQARADPRPRMGLIRF